MSEQVINRIEKYIRTEQLSPEQIVGLCKEKGYMMVSKSTIYNYIREDKKKGGDLYKHCRFQLKHRKIPDISRSIGLIIPNKYVLLQAFGYKLFY